MGITAWLGRLTLKGAGQALTGSIGSYWKIGLSLALLAALATAAWKISGAFSERAALLEERQGTIANLTQDLTIASFERDSATWALQQMQLDKLRIEANQQALIKTQKAIREEIKAQKDIFTRQREHSFEQLVQAKPGLIEKLANQATQERLDALAAALND